MGAIQIEACILAGGLSSRMGTDKAVLRLGRRTMLGHIRATAEEADLPVRVIRRDLVPRCGPLGGVYTALRTTRADAVLFLSCDMPFLTARLLRQLVARLNSRTRAVFLYYQRPGFPFLIRKEALADVEARLGRGELSLGGLAEQLGARWLKLRKTEAASALNLNTPSEYQAALRHWKVPGATGHPDRALFS